MVCRQCNARISREDKRADGLYECPACGKLYRVKQHNAAASAGGRKKAAAKRKRRKTTIFAAVSLVLALSLLFVMLPGSADRATPTAQPSASAAPTPTPSPEPILAAEVRFRAVGDIMSHRLQLTHALQDDGTYNYDSQFRYMKDALAGADYTIANLELSIAPDGKYSSYPFFRTPEAILDTLADCGVDMFTLANNHILDGFFEGLTHTIDRIEAHGFDHLGAYRTAAEAKKPCLKDINGIRFGFLAYTTALNGNDKRIEADQAAFCVKLLDEADFRADVQQLRDLGAEVVICLPHWGKEGKRSVAEECRAYARQMVDAGVDIILGSHPHVVLPIDTGEVDVAGEKPAAMSSSDFKRMKESMQEISEMIGTDGIVQLPH